MYGVKEALQILVLVCSLVGGILALLTYWRNSRLRRAEWLYSLFQKFYELEHYRRVRHAIDYETEELDKLRTGLASGGSDELVELCVDYLNFFEFIAALWRWKQLSLEEIRMVFEYYLTRLKDFDFLMDFIHKEGFENLSAILAEMKKPSTTQAR